MWHNIKGADWEDLPLEKQPNSIFNISSAEKQNSYRYIFSAAVLHQQHLKRPCSFTLRYRTRPFIQSSSWQWTNQNFGSSDGVIVFQQSLVKSIASNDTPATFNLGQGFKAERFSCEAPGAELWEVVSDLHLPPVTEGDAPTKCRTFGSPKNLIRWFSLVRIWSPWCMSNFLLYQ